MTDSHPSELLIRQRLAALTRTLPSASGGDVNAIHQARVATRRVRAALPIATRGSRRRKLKKSVTHMTRALGGVRELDVAILTLDELASDPSVPREGLEQLRVILQEERQRFYAEMNGILQHVDLDRLQRKTLAAAERATEHDSDQSDVKRLRSVIKRAGRRAFALQAAIENAGNIYLADRLHQVRIAVKKLRYVLEIARELSRSRASARIRMLKNAQDLLGRMHDLEVLIARTGAVQASSGAPNLRLSGDLDSLVRRMETECRLLHGQYMASRAVLLDICERVEMTAERAA